MYYVHIYVSVQNLLLDDTERREPVYCLAHTASARTISPVVKPIYRDIIPALLAVYIGPVAKIGYTQCLSDQNRVAFYLSVRQAPRTPSDWPRRPPPDDGHTAAG